MESQVSPLLKSETTGIQTQPLYDDPYAYVTQLHPLTKHQYYYLADKIEHGWITERDIEIVRFLFVHRWLTLTQIAALFFPDTEREATVVRHRLSKLIKHGLIRKIQWSSYYNPTRNRPIFYEIGAGGADILKYRYGTFLGQRDPRIPKETNMLFRMKYVTTNELYIQLKSCFDLTYFEFHPVLTLGEEQQVPTAKYTLRNPKGKLLTYYLLCHREDEKWLKTIRYQANFYNRYLTSEKESILTVLVSSDQKAELASKVLEQEGISQNVWFLTDEDLFNTQLKLSESFFFFQQGRKNNYDLR